MKKNILKLILILTASVIIYISFSIDEISKTGFHDLIFFLFITLTEQTLCVTSINRIWVFNLAKLIFWGLHKCFIPSVKILESTHTNLKYYHFCM